MRPRKCGIVWQCCLPVPEPANQNLVCSTMATQLQRFLTNAGTWLSRPWVVMAVLLYTVIWLIFDSRSFGWHGVATIATLLMTLFIQRSEHRDTQAITRSSMSCSE